MFLCFPGEEAEVQREKAVLADQCDLPAHLPSHFPLPQFPHLGCGFGGALLTCGSSWQDAKYLAISGFLFLRFFAPAILTPKLFDLRDQHADPQTSRSLLLLAKVLERESQSTGTEPEGQTC